MSNCSQKAGCLHRQLADTHLNVQESSKPKNEDGTVESGSEVLDTFVSNFSSPPSSPAGRCFSSVLSFSPCGEISVLLRQPLMAGKGSAKAVF